MPINLKQGDNAVTEDKVDTAWGTSGALSPTAYTQHLIETVNTVESTITYHLCSPANMHMVT